jgi:beta-phosphoglucomutase
MSHRYDALLFDFDGVLADTEHAHHSAWNTILKPFGIQFTWPEYLKECVGVADILVAERLKLVNPPDIVARKQQVFRETLERNPPFAPQTLDLIPELASSCRVAVVSSSFRSEVLPPLERAGLLAYFETVICGNDVKNFKPAPDPYLLAVERLGVHNPLVIEDSDSGVASGKAAGLEVLRVSGPAQMPAELRSHLSKER